MKSNDTVESYFEERVAYTSKYFGATASAIEAVRDYIPSGRRDRRQADWSFVIQCLCSSFVGSHARNKDGWFPMDRDFIREHFGRSIDPRNRLSVAVECDERYSKVGGKCLWWRPTAELRQAFTDGSLEDIKAGNFQIHNAVPASNLFGLGAPISKLPVRLLATHLAPLQPALSSSNPPYVGYLTCEHLELMKLAYQKMEARIDKESGFKWFENEALNASKMANNVAGQARLAVSISALGTFQRQTTRPGYYHPIYCFDGWAGRAHELGTGAQGCPNGLKAAVLLGTNYDLAGSHARLLLQMFEAADMMEAAEWVKGYNRERAAIASQLGISEAIVKVGFYAIMNGSDLNPNQGAAASIQADACEEGHQDPKSVPVSLKAALHPLIGYCRQLAKVLKVSRSGLGECATKIESLFIHSLVIWSVMEGHTDYRVESNQHDGLVVEGTIPQEAIDWASMKSGYLHPELRIKPFG